MDKDQLLAAAKKVLETNNQGSFTIPAHGIYPHQWLWDSCFIAIGLRHIDPARAMLELESTLRGQWHNGMIAHMILMDHKKPTKHEYIWNSARSPFSPDGISTSGITQPPILAEAVWQVGQKLPKTEARTFYAHMLPALLKHHEWLYRERNPGKDGLIVIIHPWESGMDNSPGLIQTMRAKHHPLWIKVIDMLQLEHLAQLTRLDFKRKLRLEERTKTIDELHLYSLQRRLDRQAYNNQRVLRSPHFAVQDVGFNSILIRSNQRIIEMSQLLKQELPPELMANMRLTARNLESLYDPAAKLYYSRDYISKKLIRLPTVASLLPLYSGALDSDRAESLSNALANKASFWTEYPVPSVAANHVSFDPQRYWQGASWLNTNWLLSEGLATHGLAKQAKELINKSVEMIDLDGMHEYFDSLTGKPLGASNFSWTAALAIDLLHSS